MERAFAVLDRLAAGRRAGKRAHADALADPRVGRTFRWALVMLVALLIISAVTVATALWLKRQGEDVGIVGWMRGIVALLITCTLFYFWLRARSGAVWAWSRLTLFSKIFPLVTLAIAAVPNLLPVAIVTEMIVFSMVLLAMAWTLDSRVMRAAFVPRDAA
jgi:hypothetical protein